MKEPDLKKIHKAMEKELDPKRYEHTLGVAYTAASLAMCYGADLNSALIAGMLHDCAKCLSNEKKISICKKHDLPINPAEEKNPFLLHAKGNRAGRGRQPDSQRFLQGSYAAAADGICH